MFALIQRTAGAVSKIFSQIFLALIWFYQNAISPWLGANCRFRPTCSAYACEAIKKYGPIRGSWLAAKRILRCRPGVKGGYDPVP